MTKAEKHQEWERLITDYRASGQTAKEGVPPTAFLFTGYGTGSAGRTPNRFSP